jgi:CDP-diacylglycerol--glycerol-3-phosphate 3-phosphatidyltransferase
MLSVYQLKPAFQALLRPLVRRLAAAGVSANQVTIGAALLSLAHGAWLALGADPTLALLLLPATLLLRMALNAVDGLLAREHGQQSRLGALLNELGDLVSDLALYLPLAALPEVPPAALALALAIAVLAEFTGVCALLVGSPRRYDGPMGKSDRALAFGLLALLLGLDLAPAGLVAALIWGVALLGLVTVWNRARHALAAAP